METNATWRSPQPPRPSYQKPTGCIHLCLVTERRGIKGNKPEQRLNSDHINSASLVVLMQPFPQISLCLVATQKNCFLQTNQPRPASLPREDSVRVVSSSPELIRLETKLVRIKTRPLYESSQLVRYVSIQKSSTFLREP